MSLIAVVDYGMGNLRSVDKALEHVAASGQEVRITSSAEDIASADRVVFPGQGAARDCMRELKQRNLVEPVMQAAKEKPFLGICMGLQVLMSHSEENNGIDCMDLYKGEVRFFGNLSIEVHKCIKSADPFNANNLILLTIFDNKIEDDNLSVFHGWIVSSNPSISTLEHPVYEVIAVGCKTNKK